MDLSTPKYFQSPPVFASDNNNGELATETSTSLYGKLIKNNPFADTFPIIPDPLCKLNLKETSDFVKSFPVPSANTTAAECKGFLDVSSSASAAAVAHERRREGVNSVTQKRIEAAAPSTPGRPVFSFSTVSNLSKKNFPSKWDDAEKWLMSSSCHDSPAHSIKSSLHSSKNYRQCDAIKQQIQEVFAEKSRVTEEKVSKVISSSFQGSSVVPFGQHNAATGFKGVPPTLTPDVLLKDKFTDEVEPVLPNFRYSEPSKQGFIFRNSARETMKDAGTEVVHELEHKDVGTEMTPLGSSTTSRCHTPFKSSSPARHNTPANRSGPLAMGNPGSNGSPIDIFQLEECHFSKLQLGTQYDSITSNWSSREEEEEEISKSLRHFETGNACRRSVSDSRAATWEEEEKTKCCFRYQREEAKIQAWVNLQSAKAEAQSRKLEVKIERMRSNLEEKLMKRMAVVHRKAEEWRATARQQHTEQMRRGSEQAHKIRSQQQQQQQHQVSGFTTCCGCFPCNINHH